MTGWLQQQPEQQQQQQPGQPPGQLQEDSAAAAARAAAAAASAARAGAGAPASDATGAAAFAAAATPGATAAATTWQRQQQLPQQLPQQLLLLRRMGYIAGGSPLVTTPLPIWLLWPLLDCAISSMTDLLSPPASGGSRRYRTPSDPRVCPGSVPEPPCRRCPLDPLRLKGNRPTAAR